MRSIHRVLGAVGAVLPLALLPCCSPDSDGPGTAMIVFTDAGIDDLDLFEVDVTSLVFQKAGGSTVSALPRTTRIDFTELEEVSDLVSRVSLEAGFYSSMTLTLDFQNAKVYLNDETTPATLLDGDGQPLTGTLDIPIDFAFADRPNIVPNRTHAVQLDLDLSQAISVDVPANEVTFLPVLSVEVDPLLPKPIVASGILISVDTASNRFVLERRSPSGESVAQFTVGATALTGFQVSGELYLGSNGIAALDLLPVGTSRVFVQGVLHPTMPIVLAAGVESGSGVPGNGQDWVAGYVTGRTTGAGNDTTLTVLGRSRTDATGSRTFNTLHTVDVQFGVTKVLRRGWGTSRSVDELNVGQLVVAFGTLTGTALDATAPTGVVRMLPTTVYGTAAGVPSGNVLTIDVTRFGPRTIGLFDFNVGGLTEADPTVYTVDVTGFGTTGIVAGSKICATGWPNPVGVLSDENFDPTRLVNRSVEAKLELCAWAPGVPATVLSSDGQTLSVDVQGAVLKFVYDGFDVVTLADTPMPTVVPRLSWGIFRIVQNGGVALHLGYSAFLTDLEGRLSTAEIVRVAALGTCDATTQEFSANVLTVVLR